MSRRRGHKGEIAFQLFSFLDVLLCTIGALIIILTIVIHRARASASEGLARQAAPTAEEIKKQEQALEDARWRQEQLEQNRTRKQEELQNARLTLSHLEDHIRRLNAKGKELLDLLEQVKSGKQAKQEDLEAARLELAKLKEELAKKQDELARKKKDAATAEKWYALIPYDGPNGTRRMPIYIECVEEGVVIQPEGVLLTADDFRGEPSPGNPLDAALRTKREYIMKATGGKAAEPYPLLVVRPSGVLSYGAARAFMKFWDDEFGYELISEEKKLDFGLRDPNLDLVMHKEIAQARKRQAVLAMSMPRKYNQEQVPRSFAPTENPEIQRRNAAAAGSGVGNGNGRNANGGTGIGGSGVSGSGVGSSGTGGREPGSQGTRPEGSGLAGTNGAGQPGNFVEGSNTPGDGIGPYGSGGGANSGTSSGGGNGRGSAKAGSPRLLQPNQEGTSPEGGSFAGGTPGGNSASGSTAPSSGDSSANDASQGTASGGNPSALAGSPGGSPGGSAGAGSVGSPGSPAAGGQSMPNIGVNLGSGQPPPPSSAGKSAGSRGKPGSPRGKNWGLPEGQRHVTGVTRPLRVAMQKDQIILLPDIGEQRKPQVIPLSPEMSPAELEALVQGVQRQMRTWGIAVDGGHWKPALSVDVQAGAEGRFAELQSNLHGSGIEIQRKLR